MEAYDKKDALRRIPPVNELLCNDEVMILMAQYGKDVTLDTMKHIIDEYREHISGTYTELAVGTGVHDKPALERRPETRKEITEYLAEKLKNMLSDQQELRLKRVINATGIILHTNLGRAPLPEKAIEQMREVSEGYSNLELDLNTGSRGSRHAHIEPLITAITGAESAMIVNNNAAAVFLCLNTLSNGEEVVLSRGQQIEIGGSFRIPDIIIRSGAKMIEVGTTNKTRLSDYANALSEDSAVLLKVHTSNYKVSGFTEEVSLEELAGLGKDKNIVVMEDLGSGSLYDLSMIGLPYEPTVQDSIQSGADLVTFSGDKLLGGPQAGIIAGKRGLIDKIRKNPLARMVRCDKTTIAAMTAVLSIYMDTEKVVENIPVLKMMSYKENELSTNALELYKLLQDTLGSKCKMEIVNEQDEVGGGSLPGVILDGKAVAIIEMQPGANEIQTRLRKAKIPIICRIHKGRILFNLRTLEKRDYPIIAQALAEILE